jgi:hypothetical protein
MPTQLIKPDADGLEAKAVELYKQHKRARFAEIDDNFRRQLADLYAGCRATSSTHGASEMFTTILEDLDALRVDAKPDLRLHLLRPKAEEPTKLPEIPAIGEAAVRNPYEPTNSSPKGNAADQRALKKSIAVAKEKADIAHSARTFDVEENWRAIEKRWRDLDEHWRRSAQEPFSYAVELAEAEAARERRNQALAAYSESAHKSNVFATGDRDGQREFHRDVETGVRTREAFDLWRSESAPLSLELFGRAKNKSIRGAIFAKLGPVAWQLIEKGDEREKTLAKIEYDRSEAQRVEDLKAAARQAAALREARIGLTRLPDGRVVAGAAKARQAP